MNDISSEVILATEELVKEIKSTSANFFIKKPDLLPKMEWILTSAIIATLSDSIALSISTRTEFMPSEEETTRFIKQFQDALDGGVRDYLTAWANQQEKLEELIAGTKPTEN